VLEHWSFIGKRPFLPWSGTGCTRVSCFSLSFCRVDVTAEPCQIEGEETKKLKGKHRTKEISNLRDMNCFFYQREFCDMLLWFSLILWELACDSPKMLVTLALTVDL